MSTEYIIRRVLVVLPQLLILSVITFGLTHLVPGDPVTAMGGGLMYSDEQLANIRIYLGLDRPIYIQYFDWLGNVLRLNFGVSFLSGDTVIEAIGSRLVPTLLLTTTALILSLTGGVITGVLAANWRNSLYDHIVTVLSFFFLSMPSFWSAIMSIILFSIVLGWLPASGMTSPGEPPTFLDVLRHLVLPATVLGLVGMAEITRFVRSSMIEVMREDYVRTARAKGLREGTVLRRHALRNALMPVVTIIGLRLPGLFGGAVLIEKVFSWPGIGTRAVQAAYQRDYPITMTLVMVAGFLTIVGNLAADLAYGYIDPRTRGGEQV